jgi:hypothetical protein
MPFSQEHEMAAQEYINFDWKEQKNLPHSLTFAK